MSKRTENPKPGLCVAAVRRGSKWNPYREQCENKRREGREWCGVHDPGGTGVLVYGARLGHSSGVVVEFDEVMKEGPKTLTLKSGLRALHYRRTLDKDEAAFSPLEALANLLRSEEAKRDAAAKVLAAAEARVAQARAAYALEGSAQKELDPQ